MANTFLGYEIASPERQRKTALAIVGVVCALAVAGMLALFFISRGQHSGRELTVATIAAFETKCRYVVRNIGKRVSYYDHTGLIDCDRAHEVAQANDSILGSVRRTTVAVVDLTALDGSKVRSHIELSRKEPFSIGEQVEVLYRIDDPRDLREHVQLPLGFGKRSIAPLPENHVPSGRVDAVTPAKPRPSDAYSKSTLLWIGLATLVVGVLLAYLLIRGLYRAIRWLVVPGNSMQPIAPVNAAPIARGRVRACDEASRRGRVRSTFALKRDFGLGSRPGRSSHPCICPARPAATAGWRASIQAR